MTQQPALGTLPAAERIRLGAAGLRTFFRIADQWRLSVADQCALLGDIGRTTHHTWRNQAPGTPESYTTDRLTRLSYLLGIYGMLQRLYGASPAFSHAWIASPNTGAAFQDRSPLALIRELGIPGMHLVRWLLEAEAGGGLADADDMAWAPATGDFTLSTARADASKAR